MSVWGRLSGIMRGVSAAADDGGRRWRGAVAALQVPRDSQPERTGWAASMIRVARHGVMSV
jgi:hypothetical protein